MSDRELIEQLTRQQEQLQPSYETCLGTITAYFTGEGTAEDMNNSLVNHGAHILDVAQEFLGERDIYDHELVGAFVASHTLYHVSALQTRIEQKTVFTSSVSPETILQGTEVHVSEIIERAKEGEEIDVIEEAHLFVIGVISDVVNNIDDYANNVRQRKRISQAAPTTTFVLKRTLF